MSCMTHSCDCGFEVFNNSKYPRECPECGSALAHTWDEEPDRDPPPSNREYPDDEYLGEDDF